VCVSVCVWLHVHTIAYLCVKMYHLQFEIWIHMGKQSHKTSTCSTNLALETIFAEVATAEHYISQEAKLYMLGINSPSMSLFPMDAWMDDHDVLNEATCEIDRHASLAWRGTHAPHALYVVV